MHTDFSSNDDHGLPLDPVPPSNDDHALLLDTVPTSNDDPGIPLDSEPVLQDDLRLNMEYPILPEFIHCVNCGTNITQRRSHILNLTEVRRIILQWIAPQIVEAQDQICHSCWTVALNASHAPIPTHASTSSDSGRQRQLCIHCRTSLMRIRSHMLNIDAERERRIRSIVIQWINPLQLSASDRICHPCWQRADRQTRNVERVNDGEQRIPEGTIFLPDLRRPGDTQSHCFLPGCNSEERFRIPKWLRIHIFTEYNYYIPQQCRICQFHLRNNTFNVLEDDMQSVHYFTANHIQDFASFVKERKLYLDFRQIEQMNDDIIYYWTGVNKDQFLQLKADVPNLNTVPNSTLALAAFLIKIRTGDSNERISMLLNVARTTLGTYLNKVREILVRDFVPRNLGIEHIIITRDEIAARNLLIPNGLFGGEDRKPIVIMDGTYLYIQKSSNYKYQKDTYSLHKYRNLLKPFLMVCSDGYIIDVLGPYPATTSDAKIIMQEFNNNNNSLRRYFQPGDVFIVDRGFRDCLPLLEECQYSVHFPLFLQQGESQLSTAAANKSRMVTICRWVVEAVNGIFKMSYKLFRSEFFNTASTHAMSDFRIAAALINKFHQRITDRPDANQILNRILEKRYTENTLANYIIENNLNRMRAQFSNIHVSMDNVTFPRLTYSDLILLACGTYQLKQARSYYGEHIRNDGSYTIEVCSDRASNLLQGLVSADNCTLIRGKIQSRHISRKTYFIYILIQNNMQNIDAIKHYYCNCIVGRRTVGCCSHIMSVIWYLSWARYDSVTPPAQFLDNVLLTYEDDDS